MCVREGVLMVVKHHRPWHVRMVLESHAAISMREEGVAWGCWRLDMVGGTEDTMVRSTRPGCLVM